MAITNCIECDTEIALAGRPRLGLKLTCPSCGARLEVVGTNPVEVDWADESEDEWDDEEGESDLDDDFDYAEDDFDDDYDEEEELEEDEEWR
jgi:lysine biosynthesis protein LysW